MPHCSVMCSTKKLIQLSLAPQITHEAKCRKMLGFNLRLLGSYLYTV